MLIPNPKKATARARRSDLLNVALNLLQVLLLLLVLSRLGWRPIADVMQPAADAVEAVHP
jgi:F0F1-type ATP synthase membrane subunit b/b'